ncbi:MAG: bifunctional riboflavin kinase/FAD synthetase [Hyphomicrobiaceae bacterium]
MKVIKGFDAVPEALRGSVLAIGNFDGVHRGHQALLMQLREHARSIGAPAGVMVFEPHPRLYFKPDEPLFTLTPIEQKLRLLEALKLDFVAVIPFDKRLADLPPADFADRILVEGFGIRHVVVGYDFYFGKGRAGTPDTMRELGAARSFGVTVIAPVAEAGEVFSSSAVRERLSAGDVRGAADELGHWWRVDGLVTGGARRGTGMGFPTANITLLPGTALGHGIFAVEVVVDGRHIDGAAYFGQRPTFDNGAPVLEVFLFDFDGDIYGQEIEVSFIGFVRPDQRFRDMEELKAQMQLDCERARQLLEEARNDPSAAGYAMGSR